MNSKSTLIESAKYNLYNDEMEVHFSDNNRWRVDLRLFHDSTSQFKSDIPKCLK